MDDQRARIEELLDRAKQAHGEYERTELGGVYDQDWPRWYAGYLVREGLGALVGRDLTADEVAALLESSWAEQQRSAPDEPWERFTADRIAAELRG